MVRQFNEGLTDEDLKKLPVSQFAGRIVLVDTLDKFYPVLSDIKKSKLLGFDTETKPSFKKGQKNKVSLLQLADDHQAWIFRLNTIGLPRELAAILSDPSITKVGVAIHDDIKALRNLKPFEPAGFVDLQSIVANHGIKELGLKKLSAIVLGFSISKSQQVSNWETPALTWPQQLYAATDAWVCRRIFLRINGHDGY
ncbi:MAG TPA: 3'-5' exonuclease [Bacteroidales bacterium]|nr:3'-5' exonuclease [Bacteroidales bacterium]